MLTYKRIREISREFIDEFNEEFCKSNKCTVGFNYVDGAIIDYYGKYMHNRPHIVLSCKAIIFSIFDELDLIGLLAHECGHHIHHMLVSEFSPIECFDRDIAEYFANNFSLLYRPVESKGLAWYLGDARALWKYNKRIVKEPNFWYKRWKRSWVRRVGKIILSEDGDKFINVEHPLIARLLDGVAYDE